MELQGAKALVTGGSEGIGFAIGERLIEEGADVGLVARRADPLERAAEKLGAHAIRADIGVEEQAVAAVRGFVDRHGRLDILVNNAGFGIFKPLVEMELEELESVFRTNVFGAFLMAREAAKQFVSQRSGHLVNIASTSGLSGGKQGTAYCSSKFALRGMGECWRAELRPHNVRVITVNPSEVQTPFFDKLGMHRDYSDKKLRARDIADAVVGALRMDNRGFLPEFSVWATNPWDEG